MTSAIRRYLSHGAHTVREIRRAKWLAGTHERFHDSISLEAEWWKQDQQDSLRSESLDRADASSQEVEDGFKHVTNADDYWFEHEYAEPIRIAQKHFDAFIEGFDEKEED